jgi:hypothetical protein
LGPNGVYYLVDIVWRARIFSYYQTFICRDQERNLR